MKKTFFLFISYLYFLSCYATEPINQCIVLLTRGRTSHLVLSRDLVTYEIIPFTANLLSGTGGFRFFIGNLGMFAYNNLDEGTFQITLSSNTYQGPGIAYRLANGTSTCKLGIYINFDVSGNIVPFANIIPTSNPYIIRESSTYICDNYPIWFYLLQDEDNVFRGGIYKGHFTLSFVFP